MINNQRLLDIFIELVKIDGVSGNENNVAEYIKTRLTELGIEYTHCNSEKIEGGNCGNLIATLPGTDAGLSTIMFSAHMDSIESTEGINTIIEDGIIKTDGKTILAADDRAGIASILEVVKVLKENNVDHPPLKLLFTVIEEKGMKGAKDVDAESLGAACGFIFDSSARPGKIIVSAPTSVHIIIKITGLAAHAANAPEKGVNAIMIASNSISQLGSGRLTDTMTFNFGKITGGKVINIVPDYCEIEAECRSHDKTELDNRLTEVENVFKTEAEKLGGSVDVTVNKKYSNFNLSHTSDTAIIASRAIEKTGLEPDLVRYAGGSDANVFNEVGIPSVNFGLGYRNAHSTSENMAIEDLETSASICLNVAKTAFIHFKNS